MDLTQLGLSAKEARLYNELLLKGPLTVKAISALTGEQRTNCYLLLKSLEKQQLVERDDLHAVLRFQLRDPANLRQILARKQQEIQNVNKNLTKYLPKLSALHKLTTERQGLAYFEDVEGYCAVQEDMFSTKVVKSFISETIITARPDIYDIIRKYVRLRSSQHIHSQFLACPATRAGLANDHLRQTNVEVRIVDSDTFEGEVTIYNHKIALTSYEKQRLSTLVITDPPQFKTFQAIFQATWDKAAPVA